MINKAIIIGNLGADPELKHTAGGQAVCEMRIATNEAWQDKNGQKQERTEWHRVVVWGRLAELCAQYLAKGRKAYVEGRLQTREWTDKEGSKRYTTEIVAQQVKFLDAREGGGGGRYDGPPPPGDDSAPAQGADGNFSDDEIPF